MDEKYLGKMELLIERSYSTSLTKKNNIENRNNTSMN